MRNLFACVAFLLFFGLPAFPSPALAEDVVILGNDYSAPKIHLDEGQPKGALIDIASYVLSRMPDVSFSFQLYPWARAYHLAAQGKGGILGLSKTADRLAIFDYSDVVYYDEVIIVVSRGHEFPFNSMEDLRGKVVGIGRDGSFGEEFEQAVASGLFTKEEDSGPVMRLKKLLAGRIDCALINPGRFALKAAISQDEELTRRKDDFSVLPKPFKRDPNYLGFAKTMRMADFISRFNAVLARGLVSGDIQRIMEDLK